jgi:alpha-ketoglutarate-dependent taurine dioxygenase
VTERLSTVRGSRFPGGAPKAVRLSNEQLVDAGFLDGAERMPRVLRPAVEGVDVVAWASANRDRVLSELLTWGAVLFRGFQIESAQDFDRLAKAISPELLDYQERAAPRREVAPNVYTSTEYPADQPIPLHHEMSYSHNWPTKLFFYCEQPAVERGATPIADDRRVCELLDDRIKERFVAKRVMYVRNYGPGLDTWQDTFQTDDPRDVERYCKEARIDFTWLSPEALRTRQVRQAVMRHPRTGELVWFNHAALFHSSNMPPDVRGALLETRTPEELPRNAFYGDGSPIEESVLDEIRSVYESCATTFPWERSDVLLLDNFLAVHGREPYVGPRKVLVAMAELFTNPEV